MRASTEEAEDLSGPKQDWERHCYEMAEQEWEFCQCGAPLKSEKEQRDGMCRECL